MKKILVLLLVLSLLVFTVSACGPKETSGGKVEEKGEVVIGTIYPVSGAMALLGDESWRGAELARQKWNEKGGIAGKQIRFINADAPDTASAKAEAERLITMEKMTVIGGSYASGLSMAASEVAERYGVIYWESGGIADAVTARNFQWMFRVCPRASSFGIMGMQAAANLGPGVLKKSLSDIKVAVVFEDGPYGSSVGGAAKKEAERLGMNVVAFEAYTAASLDLSSLIGRLKAAQPDVLNITSYLTDAILFSRQARELDFNVPIMIGNGGGHSMVDFAKAIGDGVIGIMNVDFTQYTVNRAGTPGMDDFLERYKKAYGTSPRSGHSLMNYFGFQILFEALEKSGGSVKPEDVRKAILSLDIPEYSTATGLGARFDTPTQDNAKSWPIVIQWDKIDGEYTLVGVFPEKLALREPKLPMPKWSER